MQRLYHEHLLSEVVANKLIDAYEASEREYETSTNELIAKSPELTMFSLQSADIEIAQAQKQALLPLLRRV